MSKNKLLIVALILSIMLMGVGYAAWSQTFNITAYAEAGEVDVRIDEDSYIVEPGDIPDTRIKRFNGNIVPLSDQQIITYNGPVSNNEDWNSIKYEGDYCDFSVLIPEYAENKEGVIFLFEEAYPGISGEAKFELTNFSDYPVKLLSDNTFKVVSPTPEIVLEDYITITITPSTPGGNTIIPVAGWTSFDITVSISEDLPEEYESQLLEIELLFSFEIDE